MSLTKRVMRKLAESEAVGFIQNVMMSLSERLERSGESAADTEMRDRMIASRDRDNEEVRQAVREFLAAHPECSPEAHGIPMERYEPDAFFLAVHAVSLLLRRYARLLADDPAASLVLEKDGTVRSANGRVCIPATTTRREISLFIAQAYIILPQEKTRNLGKALRQEREYISKTGSMDAKSFLRWMQTALRVDPLLMEEFKVIDTTESSVTLMPVPVTSIYDDDPLDLWKTK